jgi:predicted dehydrogenase
VSGDRRIRVGYVGAGFLAQSAHLPNLRTLADDCDLVALAEVRPRLRNMVGECFGVPKLYASHRELASDRDVEAVLVSGHFSGQGEIAGELLLAGKDVFVEKPMALSVEQADELLDAERRSGRRLMVGYCKRFDPGNRLARDLVRGARASGHLGDITYVRAHMFAGDWKSASRHPVLTSDEPIPNLESRMPAWLPEQLSNAYIGYLHAWTHHINLIRFLLDSETDVDVIATDLTPSEDGESVPGIVSLRVDGVRALIESGNYVQAEFDEHFQVYFDAGWVKTTAPPVILLDGMTSTVDVYDGNERATKFYRTGFDWSYREELRHFLHALRTDTEFESTATSAAVDVRFFESVFREVAQRAGHRVAI